MKETHSNFLNKLFITDVSDYCKNLKLKINRDEMYILHTKKIVPNILVCFSILT